VEIHEKFNTASDVLLAEAKKILATAVVIDEDKVDRLNALGFSRSNDVVKGHDDKLQKEEARANAELISKYRFKYPTSKFITENQVKEICKKYGLLLGTVDKFTGFVPEKNLKEIEAFKPIDAEDARKDFPISWGRQGFQDYYTAQRLGILGIGRSAEVIFEEEQRLEKELREAEAK
jgi:hypothetical protein